MTLATVGVTDYALTTLGQALDIAGLSGVGGSGVAVVNPITEGLMVLRTFGTDSHIWIPGVGQLNGLTAGNYIDSAGTTLGAYDNPAGLGLDAMGGLGAVLAVSNTLSSGGNLISDLGGGVFKLTMNGADPFVEFQFTGLAAIGKKAYKIEFEVWTDSGQPTELNLVTYDSTVGEVLFAPFTMGFLQEKKQVIKQWSSANSQTGFSVRYDGKDPLVAGSYFYFRSPVVRELTGIHASQATTGSKPILRLGANGKSYWQFDGGDSLALSGPVFQPSDDFALIAGANSNTATGYPMILSHSDAIGISKANLFFNQGKPCVEVAGTGGTVGPMYGSVRINETLVISGRKATSVITGRLNGTPFGTASTSALTLLPVTAAAIGCLPITAPGLFWTGSIYPVISIKGTVSDADLLTLERFVGLMSGVTIP